VRTLAHDLENSRNPDRNRARAVRVWLEGLNPAFAAGRDVLELTIALSNAGLRPLDAFHLAWAQALGADVFVTTDDRLRSHATRVSGKISFRIIDPISFARELES
jgi:predicted nucleic acid-binding protein